MTWACETRAALADFHRLGKVPLFRWGVAIGALAAEHYEQRELAQRLAALDRRVVVSSIWTMWRES